MDELLTLQETAALLKVSEICIQKWLKSGVIPGRKFGSLWRVRKSDIMKMYETDKEEEKGDE